MDAEYEILAVLWDGPRARNEIVRSVEERKAVRPSAGSIYPSLQMLEDGDFVRASLLGEQRVYSLTEKGSDLLARRAELYEHAAPVDLDAPCPFALSASIARGVGRMAGWIARNAIAR